MQLRRMSPFAVLLGFAISARADLSYELTDLGLLPNTTKCVPAAISNKGVVVGYCFGRSKVGLPFIWAKEDGMLPLTYPAQFRPNTRLVDVNVRKEILVESFDKAYLWKPGSDPILISMPGTRRFGPIALNDNGVVLGQGDPLPHFFTFPSSEGPIRYQKNGGGFLWSAENGFQPVVSFVDQGTAWFIDLDNNSLAVGSSAGFEFVGRTPIVGSTRSWATELLIWDYKTGRQFALSSIGLRTTNVSLADVTAISSNSHLAAGYVKEGNSLAAAYWDLNTRQVIRIGGLPFAKSSAAHHISDDGTVLGLSDNTDFIWTRRDGLRTFASICRPSAFASVRVAGPAREASLMNSQGQIIGIGVVGGQQHGFIATKIQE